MTLIEIQVKEALNELRKKSLPYRYDLNVYRGCSHNCVYCYARRSHRYLDAGDFFDQIFVKTNVADVLEKRLRSKDWRREIINLGGACDAYQEAEKGYRLIPEVLKLCLRYRNPIIISTKSDLILRDLEHIDRLASVAYVNIAVSITSCEDDVSKNVEPGASLPLVRLQVLKEFGRTKAHTGFHLFPIIPYLGDDRHSLETYVRWAAEAKVSYMMSGMLYLTGAGRQNYLDFIDKNFPRYSAAYRHLYVKGSADKAYKQKIHSLLSSFRKKYGINTDYRKFLP